MMEEKALFVQGYNSVAGIDEVGRGALAGPVVAAAVVLPKLLDTVQLAGVRDSKEIPASRRESLSRVIQNVAVTFGIGIVSSQTIDSMNILNATRLAMRQAIKQLSCNPDYLLIDGMTIPAVTFLQKKIIKGDKLCLSIACASIIAKVTRDRIMVELDASYPDYGLANHKGYGTSFHLTCLTKNGPSPIHRLTFAPVRETFRLL
jgi:ribonuclease HII